MPGNRGTTGLALVMICAILLAACSSTPDYPPRERAAQSQVRPALPQHPAASLAASLVGTPYRYGGSTPRGFDCSGLVYYSFRKTGVHVPRTTHAQYRSAWRVPRAQLQPGDLVFFRTDRHEVSHVGIYAGHNSFIPAPSRGKRVTFTSMNDEYWGRRFVAAGRYF